MRRTFCALCAACVSIMRSWIVSRTASAVATHQSCGVAALSGRASVEIRWRLIRARIFSPAELPAVSLTFLDVLAAALAGMVVGYITRRANHAGKAGLGALPDCYLRPRGASPPPKAALTAAAASPF